MSHLPKQSSSNPRYSIGAPKFITKKGVGLGDVIKRISYLMVVALFYIPASPSAAQSICMDFNAVSLPFTIPSTHKPFLDPIVEQNGITAYLDSFYNGRRSVTNEVEVNQPPWASNNLMRLRRASISFYFDRDVLGFYPKQVVLNYVALKQSLQIRVDDVLFRTEPPGMVDGDTVSSPVGRITLTTNVQDGTLGSKDQIGGEIKLNDDNPNRSSGLQSFLIGGEYLLIDNICIN